MHIAIVTLDGFNELDSLVAFSILHRVRQPGWRVSLCAPTATVTSMNGLAIGATSTLSELPDADAILIGSGIRTREHVRDTSLMRALRVDPSRQLVGAQCSGTLVLATLGVLAGVPACTDSTTKPWVVEAGVDVVDRPFAASGNVATAGGCLASQYLATWVIARLLGVDEARAAMDYVAPVGEKAWYAARAIDCVAPFLPPGRRAA